MMENLSTDSSFLSARQPRRKTHLNLLICSNRATSRLPHYAVLHQLAQGAHLTEAHSIAEVIAALSAKACDVVILAMGASAESTSDMLRAIRQNAPSVPLLAVSLTAERQNAVQLLRDGASGYVGNAALPTELGHAVNSVARGHRYIS